MRLLHVVHQYPPDALGGTELYTAQLAAAQAAVGHEVHVFFRRDGPAARLDGWREPTGVQVWAATSRPISPAGRFLATFGDGALSAAFDRAAAEARPDLVHVQHLMGLPASLARPARPTPWVLTLHDYWWVCANAQLLTNYDETRCDGPRVWVNCGRCALARAGRDGLWPAAPLVAPLLAARAALLTRGLRRADAVIAPTRFVRDWYAGHGAPPERLVVIPHGIETPPAVPAAARPPGGPLRVGYLGGIAPQKGVHVLLDAVTRLPADRVTLAIFGDLATMPAYAEALRRQAARPGVRFAGRLERAALWAELASLDILVVPSLWHETAGLVVQEAFAAGVPVIASDLGGLSERVHDGEDGLLVPPGDAAALAAALRRLVDEPGLLARLRAGVRPVRTMADHTADVLALYARLLEPRGRFDGPASRAAGG